MGEANICFSLALVLIFLLLAGLQVVTHGAIYPSQAAVNFPTIQSPKPTLPPQNLFSATTISIVVLL